MSVLGETSDPFHRLLALACQARSLREHSAKTVTDRWWSIPFPERLAQPMIRVAERSRQNAHDELDRLIDGGK